MDNQLSNKKSISTVTEPRDPSVPPSYEEALSKSVQIDNAVEHGGIKVPFPSLPNQNSQINNQPQQMNVQTNQGYDISNLTSCENKAISMPGPPCVITNPMPQTNLCSNIQTNAINCPSEDDNFVDILESTPCLTSQPTSCEINSQSNIKTPIGWNLSSQPNPVSECTQENIECKRENVETSSTSFDWSGCSNICEFIVEVFGLCLECFALCSDDS